MTIIDFSPPRAIRESIGVSFKPPELFIIPTIQKRPSQEQLNVYARCLEPIVDILKRFGENRIDEYELRCIQSAFFVEPLKNAMEHGNKNNPRKNVIIAIWLEDDGLLFGVRDEGDYFSKETTKKLYESRIGIKTSRPGGVGGEGTKRLYKIATDIVVETTENTLYASYVIKKTNNK